MTRKSVRVMDVVSRGLITVGGIGTIGAVSLVCLFLVWVALPLFLPAKLSDAGESRAPWPPGQSPVYLAMDEYRVMGWALLADGTIDVFDLSDGRRLEMLTPFKDRRPTAWALSSRRMQAAFGFDDGTVRLGTIGFTTTFVAEDDVPAALRDLPEGEVKRHDNGLLQRTPEGQFRLQRIAVELEAPVSAASSAIVLMDAIEGPRGPILCLLTKDGHVRISEVRTRKNLLTGKVTRTLAGGEVALPEHGGKGPRHLLLSGLGDSVYVVWADGQMVRVDARKITAPKITQQIDLVPEANQTVTAVKFMIGRAALAVGDSMGRVRTWLKVKPPQTDPDAAVAEPRFEIAHELAARPAAVTALAASPRSRLLVAGYADGAVALMYTTSERQLAQDHMALPGGGKAPVTAIAVAPKEDGLMAFAADQLERWDLDPRYPEVSAGTLFAKVWYEGYPKPQYVWQSSGGSGQEEPKYSLVPLVFGTLKATFYSMLFGAPLALLAAVYTSEFLHRRVRAVVKPTIELMASLPSVVLGFLAALVLAPYIEKVLPQTLTLFIAMPVTFLLGAHLWQLLPKDFAMRFGGWRLPAMLLAVPVAVGLAQLGAPLTERWLFGGDVMAWLDGQVGDGTGGWMFLLLPLAAIAVGLVLTAWLNPALRNFTANLERRQLALLSLAKLLGGTLLTLTVAFALAKLLAQGYDPRAGWTMGSFSLSPVGTYDQRNALIVGFVMGFAIIPIIYTIADDALGSVPEHLRSGSLGAGATPWQTAVRIIIPTAMSGLFSALMIGLGRAVGETMIVLMAAGNTPIMKLNVFNGFRTLSANIAVELPEAVRNSTHYRTLFLAALTLFVMTFILNTAAESVRLRFRRRAYQL